jgi:hypothetical protein
MSDISLLSNHYERIVELSNRINDAAIVLKKEALGKYKRKPSADENVHQKSVKEAQEDILTFLKEVKGILENNYEESTEIPHFLVNSFNQLAKKDRYFQKQLEELIQKLKTGQNKLSERDFNLLDQLLSIIDDDRTNVFRKLRNRKG